jgi:hypothetical protein
MTPILPNNRSRSILKLLFGCAMILPLNAAEPPDPTVKLKGQLREVMLQLRTAQTTAANAQAAQIAAEQKSEELAKKLKDRETATTELIKQNNTAKSASEESIARLNRTLAEREKRLAQTNEALEKWKIGYEKAAEVARTKETERAKLAGDLIVHQRTIADRERKNLALFQLSNEILDRYEGYSLGKALGAREPFIGTTRVKVENLVQGYKDKILDNRISAAPKP